MAEQLGFEEFRRDSCRIERDERLLRPRAVFVQRPGNQLLARTRLAGDQHSHAGPRQAANRSKDFLHGGCAPDHCWHLPIGFDLAAGHARPKASGTPDQRHGVVDVKWLWQVFEGSALVGGYGAIQIGVRGDHDDREGMAFAGNSAQGLHAIRAGHAHVGDEDVRLRVLQRVEKGISGFEGACVHAFVIQRPVEHPAYGGVVVDDPHREFASAHAASGTNGTHGRWTVKTVFPGRD
jgi:hypothetical protein